MRRHRSDPGPNGHGPVGLPNKPTGGIERAQTGDRGDRGGGGRGRPGPWGPQQARQPSFDDIQRGEAQRAQAQAATATTPTAVQRSSWAARATSGGGGRNGGGGSGSGRNHAPRQPRGAERDPPATQIQEQRPERPSRPAQPTRAPEPERDVWVEENNGWDGNPPRTGHATQQPRQPSQSNNRKQTPMTSPRKRKDRSNGPNPTRNQNSNKRQPQTTKPADPEFSKEFKNWFVKELNSIRPNRNIDDTVFLQCLAAMEGHDCTQFINDQLGHSDKVTRFAEQFVEQKNFELDFKKVKQKGKAKLPAGQQQSGPKKNRRKPRRHRS